MTADIDTALAPWITTKQRLRAAFIFAIIAFFAMGVPYGGITVLLGCIFFSLYSVEFALKSLCILFFVRIINTSLVGEQSGSLAGVGWLVFISAGTRIWLEIMFKRRSVGRLSLSLILFFLVAVFVNIIASNHIVISLFKLISFTFGAIGVVEGIKLLTRNGKSLMPWIIGMWLSVLLLSLPMLGFPNVGYFRDGQGFQGILNHPQALAIFCAPAAAWATISLWERHSSEKRLAWVIFFLAWTEMILTRGRVGIIAFGAAAMIVLIIALLFHRRWRTEIVRPIESLRLTLVMFFVLIVIGVASFYPRLVTNSIDQFILKGQNEKTITEAFDSSRGFLITESLQNFSDNKWLGIGFGVSKSNYFEFLPKIEPITGLPLGASTEKPNLFVALLEETGMVGAIAFIFFIFEFFRQIVRRSDLRSACVVLTAFFLNVGEMIFFSMGGLGLYLFLLYSVFLYSPGIAHFNLQQRS